MKLFYDLTRTDYGLMSLVVLLVMLGMAVFFIRLFMGKARQDAQAAARGATPPKPLSRC